MEINSLLKEELLQAVEYVNTVKLWVQLNIPRIEDGNNFGVSIQVFFFSKQIFSNLKKKILGRNC